MESQAAAFVKVKVGALAELVYVMPSIHVKLSQAIWVSVQVLELLIVKLSVTMESQPAAFVKVKVGALVEAV